MLATRIGCPHCDRALKTTRPLAVGKRVLCKQCGTTFTVCPTDITTNAPAPARGAVTLAPGAAPTAIAAAPAPVPVLPAADEEPIATELDGGRFVKAAVVAAVLGGAFLVIGSGSALALVYAASKSRPAAHARNDTSPGRTPVEPDDPPPPPQAQPVRPNLSPPEPGRLPPEEQAKVDAATA